VKRVIFEPTGACTGIIESSETDGATCLQVNRITNSVPVADNFTEEDLERTLVQGGQVQRKQSLPRGFDKIDMRANGTDRAVLTGLPKGTVVHVEGSPEYVIDDGTLEITASEAKDYEVEVDPFPYLPMKVTLHAN
jgi:hypothetical protein